MLATTLNNAEANTTASMNTILPANADVTSVIDAGRVRMGSGCRVQPKQVTAGKTVDSGKIRFGSGCRIRVLAR